MTPNPKDFDRNPPDLGSPGGGVKRDLFLRSLLKVLGAKMEPKTEPKSIKKVDVFRMLFRDRLSSTFVRKVLTFGVLLKLILMIFATFEKHENDAPV